jgi:hypothetical protein
LLRKAPSSGRGPFLLGRRMKYNANSRKNAAMKERLHQREETGLVSTQFPEVSGIVISMIYNQIGLNKSLLRTVNFFPGSYAFFKVDCVNRECLDGGFDLTHIITAMVGKRAKAAKGKLTCKGNGPAADHSSITYKVEIQYV